jgi:hypothetical protein
LEGTGPEDTFDGDYGRLLERAYEKSVTVLASPAGLADFSERRDGVEVLASPNGVKDFSAVAGSDSVEVLASPRGVEYFYTLVGSALRAA